MTRPNRRPLQRQLAPCGQCGRPVREVILIVRRVRLRTVVHPDPYGSIELESDGKTARRTSAPLMHTPDRFERHRVDRCQLDRDEAMA